MSSRILFDAKFMMRYTTLFFVLFKGFMGEYTSGDLKVSLCNGTEELV